MKSEAIYSARWLQAVGALMVLAAVVVAVTGSGTRSAHATTSACAPSGSCTGGVNPSMNLTDLQTVTVTGSGFTPSQGAQIEQCSGTSGNPPSSNLACNGGTLIAVQALTDASGGFTQIDHVYVLPDSSHPTSPIPCDATHSCVLYVGLDQNDFTKQHVFVDISFTGSTATTTTAPGASTSSTSSASSSSTSSSSTSSTPTSSTSSTVPRSTTTSTTSRSGASTTSLAANGCAGASSTTSVVSTSSTSSTSSTAPRSTSTSYSPSSSTSTSSPASSSTSSTPSTSSTTTVSSTSTTTGATSITTCPHNDPAVLANVVANPAGTPIAGGAPAGASLPFTGTPRSVPLLFFGGLVTMMAGSGLRRKVLRGAASTK